MNLLERRLHLTCSFVGRFLHLALEYAAICTWLSSRFFNGRIWKNQNGLLSLAQNFFFPFFSDLTMKMFLEGMLSDKKGSDLVPSPALSMKTWLQSLSLSSDSPTNNQLHFPNKFALPSTLFVGLIEYKLVLIELPHNITQAYPSIHKFFTSSKY